MQKIPKRKPLVMIKVALLNKDIGVFRTQSSICDEAICDFNKNSQELHVWLGSKYAPEVLWYCCFPGNCVSFFWTSMTPWNTLWTHLWPHEHTKSYNHLVFRGEWPLLPPWSLKSNSNLFQISPSTKKKSLTP